MLIGAEMKRVLGWAPPAGDDQRFDIVIANGLPAFTLDHAAKALDLDSHLTRHLFGVSDTTRRRLRRTKSKRLDSLVSDRMMRAVSVATEALELFGQWDKTLRWLHSHPAVFDGASPIELLATDAGTSRVRDELERIRDGVMA